jgi:hypothetical protein
LLFFSALDLYFEPTVWFWLGVYLAFHLTVATCLYIAFNSNVFGDIFVKVG